MRPNWLVLRAQHQPVRCDHTGYAWVMSLTVAHYLLAWGARYFSKVRSCADSHRAVTLQSEPRIATAP
jgi:hypothetical protein